MNKHECSMRFFRNKGEVLISPFICDKNIGEQNLELRIPVVIGAWRILKGLPERWYKTNCHKI
ncbi:hypothetical protein [Fluviicola sp.]|uniref:hypothetical protein n=1 Tax=Fluviicola sp. TaxID=1917219 RepID=UPI0031CF2036